jgi:hypothetical protein
MRRLSAFLKRTLVAGTLAGTVIFTGCAVRAGYYDAPHSDYHRWGRAEREPYLRWENEEHRRHRDYRRLDGRDRQEYWNWRHEHH